MFVATSLASDALSFCRFGARSGHRPKGGAGEHMPCFTSVLTYV